MKVVFSAFLCSLTLCGMAQSISQPNNSSVSSTSSIIMQSPVSNSLVATRQAIAAQESKWEQRTTAAPNDANAWLNYYTWLERDKEKSAADKKQAQYTMVEKAAQYIGQSWQFALLQFLRSGKKDSLALFSALNKAADKTVVYPYAIQFAIITNNKLLLDEYCNKLHTAAPLTASLYEYHYNTLMSATYGATIYARGLGDLAALAVVQNARHIRPDIHLKYYEGIIDDKNAYLCLSIGKEIIAQYSAAAYTGLLVKTDGAAAINELELNLTQKFSLAYLKSAASLPADEAVIYKNYLPAFILLYKYYVQVSSPKAPEWEAMTRHLAQLTHSTDNVKDILAQ